MRISRIAVQNAVATAAAIAAFTLAPSAFAVPLGTSYTFSLDVAQTKSGLPGSSYGVVTLTQDVNEVDVKVTLANGFLFANTGSGVPFAFNLAPAFVNAKVTLDAATAKYFVVGTAAGYNATPYGMFTDALVFKSGIGTGLSGQIGTSLNFSVAQAGISLDAFTTSTARNKGQPGGYSFVVDVGFAATGKTGGVGGIDHETILPPPPPPPPPPVPSTSVPEPVSVSMLGLGLAALALARRRKRK
jgi:hypothetical protein